MLAFILKASLCWLFFYGIYELFLKKQTFFRLNRVYLLSTLLLGILIPAFQYIPWKNSVEVAQVIYPIILEIDQFQEVVIQNKEASINWSRILLIVYLIGMSLFVVRFFIGFAKVIRLLQGSEKIDKGHYTLVLTTTSHLPFSFFGFVFLSKIYPVKKSINQIVRHEVEHIKGLHTIDVLIGEMMKAIFWCSPMIYIYQIALKQIHEYLADDAVVQETDKKTYKNLLISQTTNNLQLALTHQFFNSQLKNRLKMISQKRSGRPTLVMYALGIPVLLILFYAFTATFETQGSDPEIPELVSKIGDYYMETDPDKVPYFQIRGKDIDLPLFKHISLYESFGTVTVLLPEDAIQKFGEKAKLGYINFENPPLKYENEDWFDSDKARESFYELTKRSYKYYSPVSRKGTERFDENGNRIVRSAGDKIRESLMSGLSDDLPTRKRYKKVKTGRIHSDYEHPARFPGCEEKGLSFAAREICAHERFFQYVADHLKYPSEALKNNVSGLATIQFVVTEKGDIVNAKILHDLHGSCGYAALDLVNGMNDMPEKWIPALKNGKPVSSRVVVPVHAYPAMAERSTEK